MPCKVSPTSTIREWWALQLTPNGDVWGTTVVNKMAVLELPQGKRPASLQAELTDPQVIFKTLVKTSSVKLYSRKKRWVRDVFLVPEQEPLRWVGLERDKVATKVRVHEKLPDFHNTCSCADLTFSMPQYDRSRLFTEDQARATILGSAPLPLRSSPAGDVQIMFPLTQGLLELGEGSVVRTGRREGGFQLIVKGVESGVIRAWVPQSRLGEAPPPRPPSSNGDIPGVSSGIGFLGSKKSGTYFECANDLELHVEMGGQVQQVGWLRAKQLIAIHANPRVANGMISIDPQVLSQTSVKPNVQLRVNKAALEKCKTVKLPPPALNDRLR